MADGHPMPGPMTGLAAFGDGPETRPRHGRRSAREARPRQQWRLVRAPSALAPESATSPSLEHYAYEILISRTSTSQSFNYEHNGGGNGCASDEIRVVEVGNMPQALMPLMENIKILVPEQVTNVCFMKSAASDRGIRGSTKDHEPLEMNRYTQDAVKSNVTVVSSIVVVSPLVLLDRYFLNVRAVMRSLISRRQTCAGGYPRLPVLGDPADDPGVRRAATCPRCVSDPGRPVPACSGR